jgi:nitroimidazol reductase NimA-like FMN-containing flavoprotein (pyridoxamine 5'-phosphate oxidase superfamily)
MTAASPETIGAQLEELSEAECRFLLGLGAVGRIGFVAPDGLPTVLPVNYRLLNDDTGLWIVVRTRPGRVIDRAPRHVAFEIDGIDHDHQQGWSVLVRGLLRQLDNNEIELLSTRFDPHPWPHEGRTSWVAIKPQTISGRRLQTAEHEWPFSSQAYR